MKHRNAAWAIHSHTLRFAAVVAFITLSRPGSAQEIQQNFPFASGDVYVSALSGNTLYIGGQFYEVGPYTGSFVALDGVTGAADPSWPKVAGQVRTCVSDGAGGWYIGGQFQSVQGVPRINIAHILADGSVSSWNPIDIAGDPEFGYVKTIVVSGSTIYFGGNVLGVVDGQVRNYVAAVDAVTGAVTPWNPGGDNGVWALAVHGSTVYIGGFFFNMGGQSRSGLAAVNASDGLATSWDPMMGFGNALSLAIEGNTLYVGGQYTSIRGASRSNLAAIDLTTGDPTSWDPSASGGVLGMLPHGESLYLWGNFQNIGGQSRNGVAEVSLAAGTPTSWNPAPDNFFSPVQSLALDGPTVYLGGAFGTIGGQPRLNIAAIDSASGLATSWTAKPNNEVQALGVSGGRVYAGGFLTSIDAKPRRNVAAIDVTTGEVLDWDPNPDGLVRGIAVSGSTVYLGGGFANIGGLARSYLAAIDATTGLALPGWNAGSMNGSAFALAALGSRLYVGGNFLVVGGQPRNFIAAVGLSDGALSDWNPGASDYVSAMVAEGSTIYIGGEFTNAGGLARSYIAALDSASNTATEWNPSAGGGVRSLALSGTRLYAAGDFFGIGGKPNFGLAELSTATGLATDWNPAPNMFVGAVAVSGSRVYAGGQFTTIGGQPRKLIACLDATTGLATPWNPGASGDPFAHFRSMITTGSKVYASGRINAIGGQQRAGTAALAAEDPATIVSTVVSPNGGDSLRVGTHRMLEWTGTGGSGIATADLYVSRSGAGGPWEEIAYGVPHTGSYDWLVTGPTVGSNASLRVDVRDWRGNTASDVSDAAFTIAEPILDAPETGSVAVFALAPVAPNPMLARGRLTFTIPLRATVRLSLIDVQGREVALLEDGVRAPGRHSV